MNFIEFEKLSVLYVNRVPWRVSIKLLRPLPKKAAGNSEQLELIESTYVGGLSNCLPSKTVVKIINRFFLHVEQFTYFCVIPDLQQLAFDTMKSESVASDDWRDAAVDATMKLIDESGEILFKPTAKYLGTIFGEVKITTFALKSYNLSNYLCINQYAIFDDRSIPSGKHIL